MMRAVHRPGICVFFLATLVAGALGAQPLELVKDLEPGLVNDFSSAAPHVLVAVNGKVLIQAAGSSSTLWASDGTAAGTLAIAEMEGAAGGYVAQVVAATPQRAYLLQHNFTVEGPRLWRTDGTRSGTFVLHNGAGKALTPLNGPRPAASGGGLFTAACGAPSECGIWFNSGATPASVLLTPIDFIDRLVTIGDQAFWSAGGQLWGARVGQAARLVFGASNGQIRGLAALGGRLYFVAASTSGDELWVSDGTAGATRTLTAFPNQEPMPSVSFHATGGRVYFVADDVTHGQELWSTDGTLAGTRRDTDFGFSLPFGTGFDTVPQAVGGRVLFGATDGLNGLQLWARSGDGSLTGLLEPCGPGCSPLASAADLTVAGGRAFFVAADPNHGAEVWSSDGTRAGTRLLVDACPGSCGIEFSSVALIRSLGDRAAFWSGGGLWLSDGRPEGTVEIFHSEAGAPLDRTVARLGGTYFFTGHDQHYQREVWVSKGTPASSRVLTNLLPDTRSGAPAHLTALDAGRVIFNSLASGEPQAWVSDGTAAGTVPLPGVHPRTCDHTGGCRVFTVLGGIAFYEQRDAAFQMQLWRTDGTAGGTAQLTFGNGISNAGSAVFGTELFFLNNPFYGQVELWSSDGTAAGTRLRFDLPELEAAWGLTALGSELYFVGSTEANYRANVWRSDGTQGGTRRVSDFQNGSHLFTTDALFTRLGEWVYFSATAAGLGSELWRTTGSLASTVMVVRPIELSDLVVVNGALTFFAQTSPTTRGLFRTEPAVAGFTVIAEFQGASRPDAGRSVIWQGQLYFVAGRAAEGPELWRSDGTTAGTVLVRDIRAGVSGSGITGLTPAPSELFFSADDGSHGPELWRTDGSAAGTRLVEDLWPAARGSSPADFAIANGKLLFAATEERYGRELWSLRLGAGRVCVASETALCLNGGRFRVTADWRDFAGNIGVGHAQALTADTGYFWFFDPANVEVIVKVLDGRGLNAHHWVFYGALSSVEYTLTVTDVETGAVRRYFNPRGQFASVGDTQGFGPLGAFARVPGPAGATRPAVAPSSAAEPAAACVATATRLCLNGGRFAVQASWKDFAGGTGTGKAVTLTGDTGYFWFFDASNVEVVLKVLDGRPLNGKFWVFYGALSNVEYTLTVTDTATGQVRTYRNPLGNFGSVGDTSAF